MMGYGGKGGGQIFVCEWRGEWIENQAVCEHLGRAGALRFGVRRSSGAFECLMACVKLQRTGALQNAVAIFTILRPDAKPRFPNTAWDQRRWNVDMP